MLNFTKNQSTPRRGRPKITVDSDLLNLALGPTSNVTKASLARSLGISRDTLNRLARENGLEARYSCISDADLDDLVADLRKQHPNVGRRYLYSLLVLKGHRIQRNRLQDSLKRVDHVGVLLRKQQYAKTPRRGYQTDRPNAMWHMDGHHKLIHWGIVIHGITDGFSRKVSLLLVYLGCLNIHLQIMGLKACTDNKASTVLDAFVSSILQHGIPNRVRGDRGGENRDVSILMLLLRGLNRASFVWGPSVFNTRIERLWVELGRFFGRLWNAFFRRLEALHHLNRKDPRHLWLVHRLFLDAINRDCQEFTEVWNNKPLGTKGVGLSPDVRQPNSCACFTLTETLGIISHGCLESRSL